MPNDQGVDGVRDGKEKEKPQISESVVDNSLDQAASRPANKEPKASHGVDAKKQQDIKKMFELHKLNRSELDELKLIHAGMANRKIVNAFRELRTNLSRKAKGKNFICMVSSLCDHGGGSYIAMNLAASFALDPNKTSLLIDCDIYDPFINKLLATEPDYGLTDYLSESDLKVEDIIYSSGVPRLRVIPIGSNVEGGAEHFSSQRMTDFIDAVHSRYSDRFIVVDAPPILDSAEARILAELCDLVVLVVPYGKVTESQIQAGIDSVAKDKLAGVVFNN